MSDEAKTVSYVCPSAAGFSFRLGESRIKFKSGVLDLKDESLIKQLDELLEANPVFKRRIKKVDKKAALALMNAHKAERHGGVKGGLTAQKVLDSQKTPAGDAALSGLTSEQQAELVDAVKKTTGLNITKLPAPQQMNLPLKEQKQK